MKLYLLPTSQKTKFLLQLNSPMVDLDLPTLLLKSMEVQVKLKILMLLTFSSTDTGYLLNSVNLYYNQNILPPYSIIYI